MIIQLIFSLLVSVYHSGHHLSEASTLNDKELVKIYEQLDLYSVP